MKTDPAAATVRALLRVNRICDEFEQEYRAGRSPRVEDFVPRSPADRDLLFEHLLPLDIAYRRRRGERPTAAEYAKRFPARVQELVRAFSEPEETPFPAALGEYDLVRQIGSGGMGVVYLARHRRMNREVALKAIPPSAPDRVHLQERFAREVEVTAKLSHQNVVVAHDAREDEGVSYLVTAYLEGGDLGRLVRRNGPLPVADAVRAVRDAALGLGHAHERGVIHRDVKPSNLLTDGSGLVCVADWGLAKTGDSSHGARKLTAAGVTLGTVDYLAPEVAGRSENADARSDVYSLGCVLFFLLIGRPPFPRFDTAARLDAHKTARVPDVRELRPDVPAALAALVSRMLAKNPAARPQDMNAVVAAVAPKSRRTTRRVALAALVAAVPVGAIAVRRAFRDQPAPVTSPRPEIAEMPFPDPAEYQRRWADHLRVPVARVHTIGSVAFTFVLVPPGKFRMGTPDELLTHLLSRQNLDADDRRSLASERERVVTIPRPFYLGTTEVTVRQFALFVERSKHVTRAEDGAGWGYLGAGGWELVPGHNWKAMGKYVPEATHPIGNVALRDAEKFAEWLGPTLGATCRLPCESEWEYASRGGRYGVWAHGDDAAELRSFAVSGTELPAPVGGLKPNGFGLFDMLGNSAELCELEDRWTDAPVRPVPSSSGKHPVRGGRFNERLPGRTDRWPEQHRCARRHWEPDDSLLAGFRVLLELPT